jgi:hypothetical protein
MGLTGFLRRHSPVAAQLGFSIDDILNVLESVSAPVSLAYRVALPELHFSSKPGARDILNTPCHFWRCDMLVRPRDLADRMSGTQQPETFTLPIDAARLRAREILAQLPQTGYMAVLENWRQLSDGRIEFTKRHLPTAD